MAKRFNVWHLAWLIPLCIFAGMVTHAIINSSVDEQQADMVMQSLMILAAYESAAEECVDFETRMCLVQGKNARYLELLQSVYGVSEFEAWSME